MFKPNDRRRIRTLVLFVTIIYVVVFTVRHSSTSTRYSDYLIKSLEGPLKYDDPHLIQFIKYNTLEPPSRLPYDGFHRPVGKSDSEKFYEKYSQLLFGSKMKGFFVEAGALDGEALSNTLSLEMRQGWTGLLVEPDPANYIALKRKHRKAWTARACLTIYEYPKKEILTSFDGSKLKLKDSRSRAMGTIVRELSQNTLEYRGWLQEETENSYYKSQCFRLESLLLALDVTRVDLLSLDIEFFEEEILRHFDFQRFDIQVLFMEWWNHGKLLWLREFMESKGFIFVVNTLGDIIFVKKNSEYYQKVIENDLRTDLVLFVKKKDGKKLNKEEKSIFGKVEVY